MECVRVNQARTFDYDWQGQRHYLAQHDIVLEDGANTVGGAALARRSDLRDTLTFVPQNVQVSGWCDLAVGRHGYAAIFFDPAVAEAECERSLNVISGRPLIYFEDARLCQTLRRIESLVAVDGPADPIASEKLALLAVLQLYPQLWTTIRPAAGQLSLVQQRRLANFIEARIGSAISLSEMAAVTELSRYHFARSFSRTVGRAPHQYMLLRRIGLAASLLATSSLPISEIALRVGFSSPARLSVAFSRIVGRSPRSFRQDVGAATGGA